MEITRCKNCGYELYPLDTVCEKCGTKVTPAVAYDFNAAPAAPPAADMSVAPAANPAKSAKSLKPIKTTGEISPDFNMPPKTGSGVSAKRILIILGCVLGGLILIGGSAFAVYSILNASNEKKLEAEAVLDEYDESEDEEYFDEEFDEEEITDDETYEEDTSSEEEFTEDTADTADDENDSEDEDTEDSETEEPVDGEYDEDGVLYRESDREWINDLYNSLVVNDYLGVKDMISDIDAFAEKAKDYAYKDFCEWEDPNFGMPRAFRFKSDDGEIFGAIVYKSYEHMNESDPYTMICAFLSTHGEEGNYGFDTVFVDDHYMELHTEQQEANEWAWNEEADPFGPTIPYYYCYFRDNTIYYDSGRSINLYEGQVYDFYGGG